MSEMEANEGKRCEIMYGESGNSDGGLEVR